MRSRLTLSTCLAIMTSACGVDADGTDTHSPFARDAQVVTEDLDASASADLDTGLDADFEELLDAGEVPDAQELPPVAPDAGVIAPKPDAGMTPDASLPPPSPTPSTPTPTPPPAPTPAPTPPPAPTPSTPTPTPPPATTPAPTPPPATTPSTPTPTPPPATTPPTPTPPTPTPPAPPSVKFTQVYAIIWERCAFCHMIGHAGVELGHLDMSSAQTAYQGLVGRVALGIDCGGTGAVRVSPSAPAQSLLLRKLTGTAECGGQMPDRYPALSTDQIEIFRQWISAGAKND